MRKLIIMLAILVMFISGCYSTTTVVTEEQLEKAIEEKAAAQGEDVDVEIDLDKNKQEMKIETDEGTIEVKSDMKNTDEWCAAGSTWDYTATTDAGNANAEWNIIGLINSGEYSGLCHVKYIATTPQGDSTMDYYFSEDGESGYFEMDVGGQVIKQEWSK